MLAAPTATAAQHGAFELVTYNVAGLPEGISQSHPLTNLPLIGGLLNKYDIALVQEDFAYPRELRRGVQSAHASPAFVRGTRLNFGDGLSQFARWPFSDLRRVPWTSCNGIVDSFFDCLTPKGFSVTRQALAEGVWVDLYNLHMDAGWSPDDRAARTAQVAQLADAIRRGSSGNAVIVAGYTNIRQRDRGLLAELLAEAGLADACATLRCPEPSRVDRVLYRSSTELHLEPKAWRIDRGFVDARGEPLSDHLAVAVAFEWQERPSTTVAALPAGP